MNGYGVLIASNAGQSTVGAYFLGPVPATKTNHVTEVVLSCRAALPGQIVLANLFPFGNGSGVDTALTYRELQAVNGMISITVTNGFNTGMLGTGGVTFGHKRNDAADTGPDAHLLYLRYKWIE